jgi:glycosyltransferase involved in cell wall biosynthesis
MDIVINGRFLTQRMTGVQRYAHELVQALDVILETTPRLTVTVLSPRLPGPPPRYRNVRHRQAGSLQGHAWEQIELPWLSRGNTLFCPGNTAPLASLMGPQRVVVTVHDLSYRYFPEAYSKAFRLWYGTMTPLILQHAAAVITVSESERRSISALYPDAIARLHAIQNGGLTTVDVEPRTTGTATGPKYILYVGSLNRRKNLAGMFETACRLARRRGFQFVFVGGVQKSLAGSEIEVPPDIRPLITFAGQIDDTATLTRYYQEAACLLFPSFYEASPLPPIEAMACGCPVVASDIPSLRERCDDAAVYCDPHDVGSIAAAVERVMDEPGLGATLRERGYRRAATYTWQRCAQETLAILRPYG